MFGIEFLRFRASAPVPMLDNEWSAEQLPHPETIAFEAGEAFSRSNDRRMLTCGPYLPLGKGYYEFAISYRSPAARHNLCGFWDITADKGTKVLDRGPLLGTLGEPAVLKMVLYLDRNQSDVEFRSYSEGAGKVFVKSIRIKRLEDRRH